jgi:hypothetical protein
MTVGIRVYRDEVNDEIDRLCGSRAENLLRYWQERYYMARTDRRPAKPRGTPAFRSAPIEEDTLRKRAYESDQARRDALVRRFYQPRWPR